MSLGHSDLPGESVYDASKCQGGLAPNIHIPFKFQDEVLTTFFFLGFCLVLFCWFSALFLHAPYFHGSIHRITVVSCIKGFFYPAHFPSQLLSPFLFCDTVLYFLQQQSVPSQ